MDTEQIINYVTETPTNTNKAVLKGMLKDFSDENKGIEFYFCKEGEYDTNTGLPIIENPKEGIIYMVPNDGDSSDKYKEYVWKDDAWELFGSSSGGIKNLVDGEISSGAVRGIATQSNMYGYYTIGDYAFAEGTGTMAGGTASHAEGSHTRAIEAYSHTEGEGTEASGETSHAEGKSTIAKHKAQHVFGMYNAEDPSPKSGAEKGTYVEIVGNGSGNRDRSNARTLDWSGNEVLSGSLTFGTGGAILDIPVSDILIAENQRTPTQIYGKTYGSSSFTLAIDPSSISQFTCYFSSDKSTHIIDISSETDSEIIFGTFNNPNPFAIKIDKTSNENEIQINKTYLMGIYTLSAKGQSSKATLSTGLTVGAAPTADMDVATKKYVDDNAGAPACRCISYSSSGNIWYYQDGDRGAFVESTNIYNDVTNALLAGQAVQLKLFACSDSTYGNHVFSCPPSSMHNNSSSGYREVVFETMFRPDNSAEFVRFILLIKSDGTHEYFIKTV